MRWTIPNFIPAQPAYDWPEPRGKTGAIYAVGCGQYTKNGMSRKFERRLKDISAGAPNEVVRLMVRNVPLAGMAYAEAWLLNYFKDFHLKNEWFNLDRSRLHSAFAKATRRAIVYEQCCAEWSLRNDLTRTAAARKVEDHYDLLRQEAGLPPVAGVRVKD